LILPRECSFGVGVFGVRGIPSCDSEGASIDEDESTHLLMLSGDELTSLGTVGGLRAGRAAFVDLDGDGDCDAIAPKYEPPQFSLEGLHLHRNDGSNNFTPW
jgi:hypothetical protein